MNAEHEKKAPPVDDYRARATRAEQENARLREQLKRKPNFGWFRDQVKKMLGFPPEATDNQVIQKVKVLRDNQELYRASAEPRKASRKEIEDALLKAEEAGRIKGFEEAIALLKREVQK